MLCCSTYFFSAMLHEPFYFWVHPDVLWKMYLLDSTSYLGGKSSTMGHRPCSNSEAGHRLIKICLVQSWSVFSLPYRKNVLRPLISVFWQWHVLLSKYNLTGGIPPSTSSVRMVKSVCLFFFFFNSAHCPSIASFIHWSSTLNRKCYLELMYP